MIQYDMFMLKASKYKLHAAVITRAFKLTLTLWSNNRRNNNNTVKLGPQHSKGAVTSMIQKRCKLAMMALQAY